MAGNKPFDASGVTNEAAKQQQEQTMSNTNQTTALTTTGGGQLAQSLSFNELERMAAYVAKSGMFACRTPEQAMTLMMLAQAEGVHPIEAMRTYHVIENRPAMRADAMQARFQEAGGIIKWLSRTDDVVEAEFSHPKFHPEPLKVRWDNARVVQAGLKRGNHEKYPRAMKSARVISEGVRAVLPAIVVGIYTPEEVEEFEPSRGRHSRAGTPQQSTSTDAVLDVEEEQLTRSEHFLSQWNDLAGKRGLNGASKGVLAGVVRKRKLPTDINTWTDEQCNEVLESLRNASEADIAKLKGKIAAPAAPNPAPAYDEPPATEQTVADWGEFETLVVQSAMNRNQSGDAALAGLKLAVDRTGNAEPSAAWRVQFLVDVRMNLIDFETGLKRSAASAAA